LAAVGSATEAHGDFHFDTRREALRLEGLREDVALIRVESEGDAQTKRFVGSPTIRIDGADMEGAVAEKKGYAYACRVYADNDKSAG